MASPTKGPRHSVSVGHMRKAAATLTLGLSLFAVACGTAAAPAPATTVPATPSPTTSPTAPAAAGSAWTVGSTSKATVRVREQLVGRDAPNDAVLVATGGTGSFELNADGTFTPASKITFDLTTLTSDSSNRDNFVKNDTINVRQFPKAELVPAKATGLALPLPASGTFTFTLTGKMTIRGVTKDVTFDVQAKRDGANLSVTATAAPSWKFGDFGMTAPSLPFRVVSIVDELRIVVDLVATEPAR